MPTLSHQRLLLVPPTLQNVTQGCLDIPEMRAYPETSYIRERDIYIYTLSPRLQYRLTKSQSPVDINQRIKQKLTGCGCNIGPRRPISGPQIYPQLAVSSTLAGFFLVVFDPPPRARSPPRRSTRFPASTLIRPFLAFAFTVKNGRRRTSSVKLAPP